MYSGALPGRLLPQRPHPDVQVDARLIFIISITTVTNPDLSEPDRAGMQGAIV